MLAKAIAERHWHVNSHQHNNPQPAPKPEKNDDEEDDEPKPIISGGTPFGCSVSLLQGMPGKKAPFGCNYVFSDLLFGEELATNFYKARETCTRLHPAADLVQPRNKEQMARLAAGMTARDFPGMWIGVSDLGKTGHPIIEHGNPAWHWVGSQLRLALTEGNWAEGQPDNSARQENCVEMWTNGLWNDAECNSDKYYACEVPLMTPPAVYTLDVLPLAKGWAANLQWTREWAPPTFPCSKAVLERVADKHAYPKLLVSGKLIQPPRCSFVPSTSLEGLGTHLTQAKAKQVCERLGTGGGLAVPQNVEQTRLLASTLQQSGENGMWIGLNNEGHPWDFNFYGTSQITFPPKAQANLVPLVREGFPKPFWGEHQPDGPGPHKEFCVELWQTGKWNDRGCKEELLYACEMPTEPMPSKYFTCGTTVSALLSSGHSGLCTYEVVDAGARVGVMDAELEGAIDVCTDWGDAAQIAEPETDEQTIALASALRATGRDSVWIGVSYVSGAWKWRGSGLPVRQNQLRWGLPSLLPAATASGPMSSPHCVEASQDGTWNKISCTLMKPWACEVPLIGNSLA